MGDPGRWPVVPWQVPADWTERQRLAELEAIARDFQGTPVMRRATASLATRAREWRGPPQASSFLEALLYVIQRDIPYVPDPAGQDWHQTPSYSATHGGDCEDKSDLAVVVLTELGYAARLRWMTVEKADQDHVTAEVYVGDGRGGGQWCYFDTTVKGARLCENPFDAADRLRDWSRLRSSGDATTTTSSGPGIGTTLAVVGIGFVVLVGVVTVAGAMEPEHVAERKRLRAYKRRHGRYPSVVE